MPLLKINITQILDKLEILERKVKVIEDQS